MAARIRVLAINKVDSGPDLDIDNTVTPKALLFRTEGLTKALISTRLNKEVKQLYEYVEGELCSIDEGTLSSLDNGEIIYAQLADDPQIIASLDQQVKVNELNRQDTLAAHLCAAIYEDDPTSSISCTPELACIVSVHVSRHGDVKFLIADTCEERFLIFRGTVTINDWKQNFKLLPVVPFCGGFLHQGFHEYSKFFPERGIWSWLHGCGALRKVVVAGHSLGGAIASIVTLRSLLNLSPTEVQHDALRVVTFGAPFYATADVRSFIEGKGWNKCFRNYVLEDDVVPRLLNTNPHADLFEAVVKALVDDSFASCFSVATHVASHFAEIRPKLAKYSPLGSFHFLHNIDLLSADGDGIEKKFSQYRLSSADDVMARLGKPALAGEWGMSGVQQHSMKQGYVPFLVQLNDSAVTCANGIRTFARMPFRHAAHALKHVQSWACAPPRKPKKLLVGHMYEYKMDQEWALVSVTSPNEDGTYSGVILDGSLTELGNIIPADCEPTKMTPCTLNVLMSTRNEDGVAIPMHMQITCEAHAPTHTVTSLLWISELTIEGLEFSQKSLRVTFLDSTGRLRLHFTGDVIPTSARTWRFSEYLMVIKAKHLFFQTSFEFTETGSRYQIHIEEPLGALSPLENILESQSHMLITKAFHRLIFEVFLGEAGSLPQDCRLEALQSVKLFQHLKVLEELILRTRNIELFMTNNLISFDRHSQGSSCDVIKKFLTGDVPQLADTTFTKIVDFVFNPHSISFPRMSLETAMTAMGTMAVTGGLIMFAGAAAPAFYYGGFAAASAAYGMAGFEATCAAGSVVGGIGSLMVWFGKPAEYVNENYKEVLTSFIEQLGGDAAGIQQTCMSLEGKLEELVLASEPMRSDHDKRDLFRSRRFSVAGRIGVLTPRSLRRIWTPMTDRLCIYNATDTSKELATMHLLTTQLVGSIRLEMLDTVYIVVLGMQNAGKSTFIKKLWPHCMVEGIGGGRNHTVIPKAFRINDRVVVVDFPGINDWEQLGFMSRKFMHMATFAVVLLKCEDIEERGRQFLNEVRTNFSEEQIAIFANQADRYPEMTQDEDAVKNLCRTYASHERLDCDDTQISLTAMLALDDNGRPSAQKLMQLISRGIKGPDEVLEYLRERLCSILRKHVSLDRA